MNKLTQPVRLDRYAALFVLALSLLFFLPALGHSVVQREQELRVALTARDMAEGGSWLEPHYLGQLRLRKPPLMYWLTATAYRIGGATDSATLARLPSALSGALLSLLLFFIARDSWGHRRAMISAIVCATSLIILKQARLAETDVLLTFFVTLAVWSGYRALFTEGTWRWIALAALASGLGFMTKGPAAFALPVLAWGAFFFARKRESLHFGPTATRLALWIALALLIAAPWYVYLAVRAGSLAQLQQELSATFGEGTQHPGRWYYYGYTLFQALAPWSLLLPFSIPAIWRGVRRNNALRFALCWFLTTFLALSFTRSKQIHYCTLLAPSASLLIGWYLGLLFHRRRRFARLALPALFIYWIISVLVVGWMLPGYEPKQAIMNAATDYRAELTAAPRVILVGGNRATWEFHSGRAITEVGSMPDAMREAQPGDLLIFNGRYDDAPPAPEGTSLLAAVRQHGLHLTIWTRD